MGVTNSEVRVECDKCGQEEIFEFSLLPDHFQLHREMEKQNWEIESKQGTYLFTCPDCTEPE